jgi:hypothetical protein
MMMTKPLDFLRTVLLIDATTCAATGVVMTAGAGLVAGLTQIPVGLLLAAGLSLFPTAAFIAFVATRDWINIQAAWLVILGNGGWVLGSASLLLGGVIHPNGLGVGFIAGQAVAVAVLAECEFIGVRLSPRAAA